MPRGIYNRKNKKKAKQFIKDLKNDTPVKMKPFDEGYTKGFNEGYAEITKKQDLIKKILADVDNIINVYESEIKILTNTILSSIHTNRYSSADISHMNTKQVTNEFHNNYAEESYIKYKE